MDHLGVDTVTVGDDEVNVISASPHVIIDNRLLLLGGLKRLAGLLEKRRVYPVVTGVAPYIGLNHAECDFLAGHDGIPPFQRHGSM
jgi:hypothetical protein